MKNRHGSTVVDWREVASDREKYQAYLCSREWAELRNAVRRRCGGMCERCEVNEMDCVHHLTYARKYRERLDDLAGWCNQCHEFTHGKTDFDPKDGVLRCNALANRLKENRYSPGEEAKLLEELVHLRRKIQGIE